MDAPHGEILCDGCGQRATAEHIAQRLRRLELATRFRPIHISMLFLAAAPPPRMEDYFYYLGGEHPQRTAFSRVLFECLMQGLGIAPQESSPAQSSNEVCLLTFQKRAFFLADAVECPVGELATDPAVARPDPAELAERYGATVVKRIQFSYRPRHIVLLSAETRQLIPLLQQAGLGDRLVLCRGLPLDLPHPHHPASHAEFRANLAEVVAGGVARGPDI